MQYHDNLSKIRKKHGLSQKAIADVLGTTQQQINKYEGGQQEMTVSRFIELANFYGITLDELAGRSPDTNSDTDTNSEKNLCLE